MKIVIFCGGYGTRMWPVSRKSSPKQFFPLIGSKSFFQVTVDRFKKQFNPKDIFVSTESKYVEMAKSQTPEIPSENIIGEPERRDNLAAVGLATAIIEKRYPGEIMFVSWSDHLIKNEERFLKSVLVAGEYTKKTGMVVSIDEEPKYPTTQNGWVKLGETIDQYKKHRIVKIVKHIEKPDLETAKKLFRSGGYLINTGYRAWRTDTMLGFYKEYQPKMYKSLTKIADLWDSKTVKRHLKETEIYRQYHALPKDSVEYGIFEKINGDNRVTIPVNVGWEDAGTWQLFYEAFASAKRPNVSEGSYLELIDSENNLVVGPEKKLISIIGLSDIAVIDTKDGLLVCNLSETGKVKELFTKLEKEKPEYVD